MKKKIILIIFVFLFLFLAKQVFAGTVFNCVGGSCWSECNCTGGCSGCNPDQWYRDRVCSNNPSQTCLEVSECCPWYESCTCDLSGDSYCHAPEEMCAGPAVCLGPGESQCLVWDQQPCETWGSYSCNVGCDCGTPGDPTSTPGDDLPPNCPTNKHTDIITYNSATLVWQNAAWTPRTFVRYKVVGGDWFSWIEKTAQCPGGQECRHDVSGLSAQTNYVWRVKVCRNNGVTCAVCPDVFFITSVAPTPTPILPNAWGLSLNPNPAYVSTNVAASFSSTNAGKRDLYYRLQGTSPWVAGSLNNDSDEIDFTAAASVGTYEVGVAVYNQAGTAVCSSDQNIYWVGGGGELTDSGYNCGNDDVDLVLITPAPTPTPEVCVEADPPSLTVWNNETFNNKIDFRLSGSTEDVQYQSFNGESCDGPTREDICSEPTLDVTETVLTNDMDKWICVQGRGKNYAGGMSCSDCDFGDGENCCVSDWVQMARCAFCMHPDPDGVSISPAWCSEGGYNWWGTKVDWNDRSSVEDGYVVFRCLGGSCSPWGGEAIKWTGEGVDFHIDCTRGYDYYDGGFSYAVRCYTDTCGTTDKTTPTPIPSLTPTPTLVISLTPTLTPTPVSQPPTFHSFVLKNSSETSVAVEGGDIGNKNHICQTEFWQGGETDRKVVFEITIADADGGWTVDEVDFRLRNGGSTYMTVGVTNLVGGGDPIPNISGSNVDFWQDKQVTTTSPVGTRRTVNFYVEFDSNFSGGVNRLYDMEVYAKDIREVVLNWGGVVPDRDFKVWDCLVGISGEFYDATGSEPICALSGFENPAEKSMNFTSLFFNDKEMDVFSISQYNDKGENDRKLVWGNSYSAIFNTDLAAAGSSEMRITNARLEAYKCSSLDVDNNIVSAYDEDPSLVVDFSALLTSEPWFQVVGAGAMVTNRILDNIPYSCVMDVDGACQAAISVGKIGADNGLVAAGGGIDTGNGKYGISENWGLTADIVKEKCYYQDLYNKYFVKAGIGETAVDDKDLADLPDSGVVFVDGNVTIDSDNSVAVDDFLMVVASGWINITGGADQVEGILVADEGIRSSGTSVKQLQIEGSLCSKGNVNLTRSYEDKTDNNTSPATVVNFRPDFVFAMPAELTQTLSGWREGN